jgi:hypothetical protein
VLLLILLVLVLLLLLMLLVLVLQLLLPLVPLSLSMLPHASNCVLELSDYHRKRYRCGHIRVRLYPSLPVNFSANDYPLQTPFSPLSSNFYLLANAILPSCCI